MLTTWGQKEQGASTRMYNPVCFISNVRRTQLNVTALSAIKDYLSCLVQYAPDNTGTSFCLQPMDSHILQTKPVFLYFKRNSKMDVGKTYDLTSCAFLERDSRTNQIYEMDFI